MKKALKYIITTVIGLLIAVAVCNQQNLFYSLQPLRVSRILCNAFFISGILITGIGLLVVVSKEGMFDGMTYYAGRFKMLLSKDYEKKRKNALSYYEYKQTKNREPGQASFILITGVGFLAVAVVFLVIFYYYYKQQ